MELVFFGVDKPSGNVLFHYPCRQHQISFKPDKDLHADVAGLEIEDRVEMEIVVTPIDPAKKNVKKMAVETPKMDVAGWVAKATLLVGGPLAVYGAFQLVKNFF